MKRGLPGEKSRTAIAAGARLLLLLLFFLRIGGFRVVRGARLFSGGPTGSDATSPPTPHAACRQYPPRGQGARRGTARACPTARAPAPTPCGGAAGQHSLGAKARVRICCATHPGRSTGAGDHRTPAARVARPATWQHPRKTPTHGGRRTGIFLRGSRDRRPRRCTAGRTRSRGRTRRSSAGGRRGRSARRTRRTRAWAAPGPRRCTGCRE